MGYVDKSVAMQALPREYVRSIQKPHHQRTTMKIILLSQKYSAALMDRIQTAAAYENAVFEFTLRSSSPHLERIIRRDVIASRISSFLFHLMNRLKP